MGLGQRDPRDPYPTLCSQQVQCWLQTQPLSTLPEAHGKPPGMEVAETLQAADPTRRPALQPLLLCLQRQEGEGSVSDRV